VALALMQLLPAYVLSSLFMTPDTPLVAAWAAALYFLQRALLAGEGRAWWGAGAALGLGLLCKYTIGLLVPATLLFVLLDPQARAWLRRPMPYVAGLLALLIFTPVIWWNAHNGWASFAFQTSQRLAERPRFSLFSLAGTALVLLSPVVLVAVPWLLRGPRLPEPPEVRRLRFARIFTLVPLSVFVLFSLRHTIKLDWTGPVWLAIVPLLAQASLDGDACGLPRWMRRAWSALAVCLLLLYGSLLHYMTLGLPGVPYSANPLPLPVVWRDLGFKVEAIAGAAPPGAAPLVVAMNRYMLASELAFYSSDPVRSARNTTSQNLFGLSGLMYERWFPAAAQTGRSLLLVALEPAEMADARLAPYVDQLGPVQTGTLQRNGRTTGVFYYRTAGGYHLPAP
jgi:dolichol-phosphate mannosyltransferase